MSNRDKQVRTLVPLIFNKLCKVDGTYHNLSPDKMLANVEAYAVAEMITDENYRKQSEVAEEVIKQIEQYKTGIFISGQELIIIPKSVLDVIKANYAERSIE